MIKFGDISVVVCGKVHRKHITKCLRSIRKYLTNSKIILSTWNDCDVTGLSYDVLVQSDNGKDKDDASTVNFQLITIQNGIKEVTTKYTLKFRTDLYLNGNGFLDYFDKFPKSDERYNYFNHRIIVSSVFSRYRSDLTNYPVPFHPADFYFFGESADVKKYFLNTDLEPSNELSGYSYKYPHRVPYRSSCRYYPEQYFFISAFRQFQTIVFDDCSDWNDENIKQSENLLFNNFIFLSPKMSGVYSSKYFRVFKNARRIPGLITYERFVEEYIKRCDSSFKEAKFNKLYLMFRNLREKYKTLYARLHSLFAICLF